MTSSPNRGDERAWEDVRDRRLAQFRSVYPDLSRYYGMGWEEIARMPPWLKKIYVEALPRLKAEEQLAALQAAGFPHMKKSARRTLHQKLSRTARRKRTEPVERPDQSGVEQRAGAVGIGIRRVKPGREAKADA